MGNNGDVLADSIFCTFPGCRAPWQWGGPGASQVPWVLSGICCGLILTGGVNILPGWREDKPSDGSGWRLVKLMAQVATPHRAFSFWPAIILIQNNFKALFITRDWPDLISVPHQGHLLVVIAFYFFFFSEAGRMSSAHLGKCCVFVFQLCDILSAKWNIPKSMFQLPGEGVTILVSPVHGNWIEVENLVK